MNKLISSVLIVIGLSFISVACAAQKTESKGSVALDAEKAPDFTLQDLRGEEVSLKSFLGRKSVLVDFTTTWCPHCVNIIPSLKALQARYKDKDLEVIAVYIRESKDTIGEFAKNHQLPYSVLLDKDGSVASLYGVLGVPTLILVDKDGVIRFKGHRIPEEIIEEVISHK